MFEVRYAPEVKRGGVIDGVIGVAANITERVQAEEALESALQAEQERSRRDSLTGTLNRAAITEVVREQCTLSIKSPVAILLVDIDGMKATNDSYGHEMGDTVLMTLCRTLSRDGAIVGRYGGDEFLVVLPGADRSVAERYSEAVRAELAELHLTDAETGATVPLAASLGIAIYPDEALNVKSLIKVADGAMYASRRSRRNLPSSEDEAA